MTKKLFALRANLRFMRLLGMWPGEGKAITNIRFKIEVFIRMALTFAVSFGALAQLIREMKGLSKSDLVDVVETLALTSIGITYYYMFICYLLNMPKMETLVTDINDFSFFKKPKDFVKINKRIEWLVAIYNFCIYGVITLYSILSYTEKSECLEENEKFEKDKICGLLANTWMAIDLTRSPINEIFICLQTYSGWVFMVGGINMFSFVFACIENLILRLNVIKAIMQEMFESDSESEKRRLLNYCIRYHVNVIEFIHRLNAAFRSVTFASISLFSLLMALAAYQFINVPSVKALLHFQGFFLTWFIICFMGQRIITQSLEFNAFLYNTPWYTQSVSIQKDFLMVLRRSQFPLEIWAGPFATMSFPTFQLVMRNTYTFVTVLSMALE